VKGSVLDSSDSGYVPEAGRVKGILCTIVLQCGALQACHVRAAATRMLAVCATLLLLGHASRSVETNLKNCVPYISNYLVASEW